MNSQYEYILHKLDKIEALISENKVEIAKLKTTARIWGGVAGLVVTSLFAVAIAIWT